MGFGDLVGGAAANLRTAAPAPGAQQSTHNASATQNDQHIHGAPAVLPSLVVQGTPVQVPETPSLLSTPARPDTNVSAPTPSAPLVAQEQPLGVDSPRGTLDWKQELKDMKALLDEGILTQEEFDAQKKRVLMQVR